MATEYQAIKIEREGGITFLLHNRPEKRNAMSPQLHMEMDRALDELADDDQTKVLVLSGAGEAFCAGQDIKLFFRETDNNPVLKRQATAASRSWRWRKLGRFPKATIAMVNGYCFGGAFTQVCSCDFAIAADEAIFGLSEVNWGTIPGGIVSWNVSHTMNYRDALWYAITGDQFDGKEAVKIGFVNRSVPKERLRGEVVALAEKLMKKNVSTVRSIKEAIRHTRFMNWPEAEDYLDAKVEALRFHDPGARESAVKQFLDDKAYRPGFGAYDKDNSEKQDQ